MKRQRTEHGFIYGSAEFVLGFCDEKKGWSTTLLSTPKYFGNDAMQIYVTKSGKVRIFDTNGEWRPPEK